MKNIVMLQKDEDGNIYCREISACGLRYIDAYLNYNIEDKDDNGYWKEGGTILLKELEEILNKEI